MRRSIKKTIKPLAIFAVFLFLPVMAKAQTVLHSASELDYPPFSVVQENGEAGGFSTELLKAALDKVGMEVDFYVDSWSNIKEALRQGKIDVLPLVGRTPEREEYFDFTVPYITQYGGIFQRKNEPRLNSIEDLEGKQVIVMEGDNAHEYISRLGLPLDIITTESYEEAFFILSEKRYDAVLAQGIVGKKIIQNLGIDNIHLSFEITDFKQDFTFAVKKGDKELLAKLNEGLSSIIASGEYNNIYYRWFEQPGDRQGESVNFEELGHKIAEEFRHLLDRSVKDVLTVAAMDFSDIPSARALLGDLLSGKEEEIWFNIGSDLEPVSQKKTIPLYKEASILDKDGKELIRFRDNRPLSDLRDLSLPDSTEFKQETFFQDAAKLPLGKALIGKVLTKYTFKEDVFRDLPQEDFENYEKVIARDVMKEGLIRFSAPIHANGRFFGVAVLSLDYRHLQALAKHIEPGSPRPVLSASYAGDYLLVFDIDGNTIIHPKPDNIRGVLENGELAGYNNSQSSKPGKIFNLFYYDKSKSYPEMARSVINEKKVFTSAATDVSGRTKLAVAVPILYDNPLTNYDDIGVFGGIMLSISLQEKNEESLNELIIKHRAEQAAKQIEKYLKANPEMTINDLQSDPIFKKLAVQKIGESGYTGVIDSETGFFYFHPQDKLVNTDSHLLKESMPEWWKIFEETIGQNCRESSGRYEWQEADGSITDKYMVTSCVNARTADDKGLFVGATNYFDKDDAQKYLTEYRIEDSFILSEDIVSETADIITRQVESYINNNRKTLAEFLADESFKALAMQKFGRNGYSYIINRTSGKIVLHPDPDISGKHYNALRTEFPDNWELINSSVKPEKCFDISGFYKWKDIYGKTRDKFAYHKCLNAFTADGQSLVLAATAYIDHTVPGDLEKEGASAINYANFTLWVFVILVAAILLLIIGHLSGLFRIKSSFSFIVLSIAFIVINGMYIFNSFTAIKSLRMVFFDEYIKQHMQLEAMQAEKIKEKISRMGKELEFLSQSEKTGGSAEKEIISNLKNSFLRSESFVYASYRINKDGVVSQMYPEDENSLGADISAQAHMIKIQNTKQPVLSNVFDAVEGFKGITIHYPVIINDEYDGTYAFLINIDGLLSELSLFDNHYHEHESFLLDNNRKIILSDKKEWVGRNIEDIKDWQDAGFIDSLPLIEEAGYSHALVNDIPSISIYTPVRLEDNTWFLLISGQEDSIYQSTEKALKSIWFFTFLILVALLIIAGSTAYLLTSSLRHEVEERTREVKEKSRQISKQLENEARMNQEKEKLLAKQKTAKKLLQEKVEELERFQKISVDRELKMIELKNKLKDLERKRQK